MKNSIVICTRNRLHDIHTCLASIAAQTHPPYEIIIVDSSDHPLNEQPLFNIIFMRPCFPETHLVYEHTTVAGTAHQRNRGIKRATGDIIYFVDDDAFYEPDYLEQMSDIFKKHPEYAGGMGTFKKLPAYTFNKYRLLRLLFLLPRDYSNGTFTWSGMPTHPYGHTKFKRVEVLGGCCAYRRTVVQQHLFDEQLGVYAAMEDCDLAGRIARTHPLFFHPAAQLTHVASPINRHSVAESKAIWIRNYSYLFFKHFYPRNKLRILGYGWSIAGLFLEAILLRNKEYLQGYYCGLRRFYAEK